MDFEPLVSVIVPVYNGSNFLAEAIDSILNQTYNNIEIIVVNDGSNDNGETEKVALKYGQKIRYYKKTNGGVASALNYGISKMKGDFFSWLSHDDLFLPDKTKIQVDILRKYNKNSYPIIYSDFDIVNMNGEYIRSVKTSFNNSLTIELLHSVKINGCTVLIPKKYFNTIGLFDENNPYWSDSKMWFLLSKKYPFVHIPETLAKTRDHCSRDSYKIKKNTFLSSNYFCFAIENISDVEIKKIYNYSNLNKIWKDITINLAQKGYKKATYKAKGRIPGSGKDIIITLIINYYFIKRFIKKQIKKILQIVKLI